MIDEKKIEEAAFESLKKGEDVLRHNIGNAYIEGFHAGINWFLDNLWHDADERPNKEKTILCEFVDKINNTLVYADINLKVDYQAYKTNIDAMCITRWLYIEDLLKGGK